MTSQDRQSDVSANAARPLWAPWRIQYIRGPREDRCFLCDNVTDGGREQDLVVHRAEHSIVIMNAFPYNAGHVLVAPKRHVSDLTDLTGAETTELMQLIVRVKRVLGDVLSPEGHNIGFNLGAAAGAGIRDHVHGHVVPRWIGDTNFMPVIGDVHVVPEALEETARLLREAWQHRASQPD